MPYKDPEKAKQTQHERYEILHRILGDPLGPNLVH